MQTLRRLPRDTWAAALDELTVRRRGAPVMLIIDCAALGEEVEAHDVLLDGVTYDPRADVVQISATRPSAAGPTVLRHHVAAPRSITVDGPAGVVPGELSVAGADGVVTIVRISANAARPS
jgi:hypothetical protein